MSTTVQNLIDFAQPFIQYSPLAVGTGNQPALGIANELQIMITNPPFTWPWNRAENSSQTLTAGTQDYTVNITDFGFLERVTLKDPDTQQIFEIFDVYNNLSRGVASTTSNQRTRPNSCAVQIVTYGTSVKFRFMAVPDKAYVATFIYQKLVAPLTALTSTGGTLVIPDQYIDIFNNLFLGEAMSVVDEVKATLYRARGVAGLLSKAEGLTQMQINAFLEQYWMRDKQHQYAMGRTTQGVQASGV